MELTKDNELAARRQFSAFCKRVIRNAKVDYIRTMERESMNMISLEQISGEGSLAVMDTYDIDLEHFKVGRTDVMVEIKDERLTHALSQLTDRKREIILLAYVEQETDSSIANRLHIDRSTVSEHRRTALMQLQKMLTA